MESILVRWEWAILALSLVCIWILIFLATAIRYQKQRRKLMFLQMLSAATCLFAVLVSGVIQAYANLPESLVGKGAMSEVVALNHWLQYLWILGALGFALTFFWDASSQRRTPLEHT